jgi:hypothetical protein
MNRPVIHNRLLSAWLHRVANALFVCCLTLAGASLLAVSVQPGSTWQSFAYGLIYATPGIFLFVLLVNPDRFSAVEGIAGDDGYDELRDKPRPN